MVTFKFDHKRLSSEVLQYGILWTYTHDNGYKQPYFIETGDEDFDTVDDFVDLLQRGGNDLYKSYSLLPKDLISESGVPEVEFDFDDAKRYIETGKFPSPEKLQQNESTKGSLKVSDKIFG